MLTVPEAVVKQMSDDPPTEKAASAENRDEPAMVGCAVCKVFCHGHEPATPWHDLSIPGKLDRRHLSILPRPPLSTSSPGRLWPRSSAPSSVPAGIERVAR